MQDKIALQDEQIADQKDAADSEDSSSEAEKGGAIDEMQDKITVQEAEIEHAADSEDSSSDTKAEKGGVVDEMQDKIALQDAQIADQQKELRLLRSQQEELVLQMDEMKRQSDDITILREAVKQLQESQAATSASSESFPIPQCDANGSVTVPTAESVDTSSDKVVGNGGTMSEVGDENALR